MIIPIPQVLDDLIEKTKGAFEGLIASRIFRGWMEEVTRSISSSNAEAYSADVTTSGNMYVRMTTASTVTLRANALEDEGVTVHHDCASGNVQVTDGFGTDILTVKGTVISYRFKLAEGWVRGA